MADDRMKNDDLRRDMGAGEGQNYGQKTPGRQGEEHGKQAGGGQGTGQQGKERRNLEDDDDQFGTGGAKPGDQNRGDQNR